MVLQCCCSIVLRKLLKHTRNNSCGGCYSPVPHLCTSSPSWNQAVTTSFYCSQQKTSLTCILLFAKFRKVVEVNSRFRKKRSKTEAFIYRHETPLKTFKPKPTRDIFKESWSQPQTFLHTQVPPSKTDHWRQVWVSGWGVELSSLCWLSEDLPWPVQLVNGPRLASRPQVFRQEWQQRLLNWGSGHSSSCRTFSQYLVLSWHSPAATQRLQFTTHTHFKPNHHHHRREKDRRDSGTFHSFAHIFSYSYDIICLH